MCTLIADSLDASYERDYPDLHLRRQITLSRGCCQARQAVPRAMRRPLTLRVEDTAHFSKRQQIIKLP
jgi:hypothetical protein